MRKSHVYIVHTLLLVILFSPVLTRQAEPRWDARDMFYPSFVYMADSINEGRWPLWDPYTNCGYPYHAEPQSPTLNPVALVLGWTLSDTAMGFLLYWLFYWWWGGIGMARLAFYFGASPAGALISTLSFSLSGYFVGHAEHTTWLTATVWLPWIILYADKAVATSCTGYALVAGVASGLSALGGYGAYVTFNGLACALWLVLRYVWPGDGDGRTLAKRSSRVLATVATIAVVSLAIWSPVLYAFFVEASAYTERVSFSSWTQGFGDPFSWQAHFSLFSPFSTILARNWMDADISMTNGYVGVLTIPLAAYWWYRGSGDRRPWWILGFFLFMYLASLGEKAGIRSLIHYIYLPARYLRFSSPIRIYWILSLALAAGLGLTKLQHHPGHRRFAAILATGWLAVAAVACGILAFFLSSKNIDVIANIVPLYLPVAVVLPGIVAVLWSWSKNTKISREGVITVILLVFAIGDFIFHVQINHETAWVSRSSLLEAESLHRKSTRIVGEPGSRLPPLPFNTYNAHLVMKKPVVKGYVAMSSPGFDQTLCNSRFVQVLQSPIRFWISPGAEKPTGDAQAIATLSGIGVGDNVPVFMDDLPAGLPSISTVPGAAGKTSVLSYDPERIEMMVDSPYLNGGFLASTERFAPSWKAWIDGSRQKVVRINVYFRGVQVPAGKHHIVWKYDPGYWRPLVLVSFLSMLLAGGIGALLIVRQLGKSSI